MTATLVRLVAVRSGERCPYCHDALARRASPCAGCGARLHRACWSALGGTCPTLGCAHVQRRRRALPTLLALAIGALAGRAAWPIVAPRALFAWSRATLPDDPPELAWFPLDPERAFVHAGDLPDAEVATGRYFGPRARAWEPLDDDWWWVEAD